MANIQERKTKYFKTMVTPSLYARVQNATITQLGTADKNVSRFITYCLESKLEEMEL